MRERERESMYLHAQYTTIIIMIMLIAVVASIITPRGTSARSQHYITYITSLYYTNGILLYKLVLHTMM